MRVRRTWIFAALAGLGALVPASSNAQDVKGIVKEVDTVGRRLTIETSTLHKDMIVRLARDADVDTPDGQHISINSLEPGDHVVVTNAVIASEIAIEKEEPLRSIPEELWYNFRHNLFKPLLLFFYMGFLVPILKVKFEFPYVIYQALTIYLLIAIGWHGGEELANLPTSSLGGVVGLMGVGFATNFVIGVLAYVILSAMTRMRRVDKATVAGFYGSDSAGTFVTCIGVLVATGIRYDSYMPVMLAIMEIPGCLVALYLVSRLRAGGMDPIGNMPDEPGYNPNAKPPVQVGGESHGGHKDQHGHGDGTDAEESLALEKMEHQYAEPVKKNGGFNLSLLHEVFLNPGLFLLFGGIVIGFISGKQGADVTRADDNFFVDLFQGILCLFLLEMGMTASRKLMDLKTAGFGFIAFGLIMPNLFATIGILVMHTFAQMSGVPLQLGSYVLFSVLCGAASYIAVPAVQRLAIPEASPTLPLAASLGLTFSYNVTVGIPVYIEIAKAVMRAWPIAA